MKKLFIVLLFCFVFGLSGRLAEAQSPEEHRLLIEQLIEALQEQLGGDPAERAALKGKDFEVDIQVYDAATGAEITTDTSSVRVKYIVTNNRADTGQLLDYIYIGEVIPVETAIYNGFGQQNPVENVCSLRPNRPIGLDTTDSFTFVVHKPGSVVVDFEDTEEQEVFQLGDTPSCELEPGLYTFRHTFRFEANSETRALINDLFGPDFHEYIEFEVDKLFTIEEPSGLEAQLNRIERRLTWLHRLLVNFWRSLRR